METAARAVFWLSLAAFASVYVAYPALLVAVGHVRRCGVRKAPIAPPLSVIIAAHDEERVIRERLENALSADYPRASLEILVASDGSTDATPRIAARYAARGVRVLALPRVGKLRALDAAARSARGDVLVFTDANALFAPGALRALAANFADPDVGGVVGHTSYRLGPAGDSGGRGEDAYWRYDTWLKALESMAGSVVSAHGGLYAVRRELYRTEPEATSATDDFVISTAVVVGGKRLVFEPDARAYETALPDSAWEFRRRIRLMTRGLWGVVVRRELLNPFRHGFYAVVFLFHKVLRRLLVLGLPPLLVSSLVLAPAGGIYAVAAATQIVFYGLAAAGWVLRRHPRGQRKWLSLPFYYCMAHGAAAVALLRFARGDRIESWTPQRHTAA